MSYANFHPTAHSKVNLVTAADQAFWCDYFGVGVADLRTAISAVGSYLVSIEDYLGRAQPEQSAA